MFSLHHGKFLPPTLFSDLGRLASPPEHQNRTKQCNHLNLGSPPLFHFQHICADSGHLDSGFGLSFKSKKTVQASASGKRDVLAWSVPQKQSPGT